ncbi:hypothetical protein HYX16_05205 [Candidatus Woesearchaeota archaeon]|nr:hypothetical protein [Candidatus Woesearchaeota archaeon]
MGWYGIFLVKKLKLAFSLRSIDYDSLFSDFDSIERFFSKYAKIREDLDYVQEIAEDKKNFSAKTTARMFNVIDELGNLPEISDVIFMLYFLHKSGFDIDYNNEDKIDLEKLRKRGWKIIEQG